MKIEINNVLIFKAIIIVLFFSNVINFYVIKSSYLIELVSVFLIFYGFVVQKNKVNKDIYYSLFFSLSVLGICLYAFFMGGMQFDDTAKETYRFFSIGFVFLALFAVKIPYRELFKFILLLCKLCVFYNVYEVIYLNIINIGNIEGLVFGKGIMDFYKNDLTSAYFLPQGEFLIPFIRPFGLWFQPQKSAFVFPIAIIVLFVYDKYWGEIKNRNFWYIVFIISTLLTGAKTAFLATIIIFVIINISTPNQNLSFKQFLIYLFIIAVIWGFAVYIMVLSNFNDSETSASAFNKDINAFINTNIFSLLFGVGFLDDATMTARGFAGEVFIVRVLCQIGIINFILCFILSIKVFFARIDKISLMILIVGFYMILHYAVINIYFFTFIICLILHHQKYSSKNEKGLLCN